MAVIADSTSFKTSGYGRDLVRRFGLTGFGHWWAREIAAMMPAPVRAALEHRRARPVLAFDGSRATLWRPVRANGGVQMTEVAQISLYADAQTVAAGGRAALAPLVRSGNGGATEVVIALTPRTSLRKLLSLPAAIEPNLHQALAYDLDRHTPFKPEELYFDAVVVDRDPARNTIQVDLAAARRAVVDPMLRHAENFGARVVAVTVEPPAGAALSRLNLLPEDRRDGGAGSSRWRFAVPAVLLGAGILAALVIPVWQKREEAISLNQQSDQARQRATVSDALRTELERKVGEYNFALERKYAFPGTVQVLDDITRILPDDTWLTQLELRSGRGKDAQRELTLRGESANAGRLVSLLEESKLFAQAAPRSPTTKIQPGPGEIFDVGAQLKPLPAPSAAPLDVTARPAPAVAPPQRTTATAPPATAPAAGTPAAAPTSAVTAATPPAAAAAPQPGARTGAQRSAPPGAGSPVRTASPQAPAANPGTAGTLAPPPPAIVQPPAATQPPAVGQPPAATQPEAPAAAEPEPADGDGNPQ